MKLAAAVAMLAIGATSTALAQEQPQWILRAGIHPVQPKPHNHEQLNVGDGAAITFAATYMLDERWGVEAFAALPVEHEIALLGSGRVATVQAVEAGLDFDVGRRWFDIDSTARLNGASLGTLEIDPYAVGLTVRRRLP